jgi:hypothetical protein
MVKSNGLLYFTNSKNFLGWKIGVSESYIIVKQTTLNNKSTPLLTFPDSSNKKFLSTFI